MLMFDPASSSSLYVNFRSARIREVEDIRRSDRSIVRAAPDEREWERGPGPSPAELTGRTEGESWMAIQPQNVKVDVSSLPRLGRAPVAHTPEQAEAYGLNRNPSMEDLSRRTLMWNPELQEAQGHLANYLRHSTCLPQRDREIAILRHAWDCGADYQWGVHLEMALDAGLTRDEIDRIPAGAEDGDWAPHEAAIIQAVDELHAASRLSDDTWSALAAQYDERQLIEFLVFVGSYRLLAYVFNSVGIRPPSGESPDLPGNAFLFSGARHDASPGAR